MKRSLQSGGTLLGFLAKILTIFSTTTNYWIRYPGGHSGLWQECNGGTCSNIPCQSEVRPAQMSSTGQTAPSTDHRWHNSRTHPVAPNPYPFHSCLRPICSTATETTTIPQLGTHFPHEVTSKSPSKPSALLPAPYRLRRPLSPAMLAVTGACMVLSASGVW